MMTMGRRVRSTWLLVATLGRSNQVKSTRADLLSLPFRGNFIRALRVRFFLNQFFLAIR